MTISRKTKKRIWRLSLGIALIVELVFLYIALVSLWQDSDGMDYSQMTIFIAIAIWIYIAFLKQRTIDTALFAVDEKIKTHTIVQHLKDGVAVLNSNNLVILLNTRAATILGQDEVAILGKDISPFLDPALGQLLAAGRSGETEGDCITTGKRIRISLIELPVARGEEVLKLLHIHEAAQTPVNPAGNPDMEQCLAAAAAHAQRLGKGMAGIITGTDPLNKGAVALAALRSLTLGTALRGACAAMGPDLRNLKRTPMSLSMLLDSVLATCRPLAQAMGVNIELPRSDQDLVINVDAGLIETALLQIIGQAILESETNGKSVTIKTASFGSHAGIAVIDNGETLPADAIPRLFEHLDNGLIGANAHILRKRTHGFQAPRKIVEAHGGTMVIDSPPEGGLRVTLMLPGATA